MRRAMEVPICHFQQFQLPHALGSWLSVLTQLQHFNFLWEGGGGLTFIILLLKQGKCELQCLDA